MMKLILLTLLLLATGVKADSAQPSKVCYERNERIEIAFETDDPRVNDKVAIFPSDTPLEEAPEPTSHWKFTCGNRRCSAVRASGNIRFFTPIANGTYRGYLLRSNNDGLARTAAFQVRNSCSDGGGEVTPDPTPAPPVTSAPTPRPTPSPVNTVPATPPPTRPPTSPPTRAPATAPTPPPSPSPTPETNNISTTQEVYEFGETITVNFLNLNPRTDDWIGIYPMNVQEDNLRVGEFWLWHCNRQGGICNNSQRSGTVQFGSGGPGNWRSDWPLPVGIWRVFLLRNGAEAPWQPIAGHTFRVELSANQAAVNAARADIEAIIADNIKLGPKFIRLSFHDCVGGCDGCVDLENPENNGLLEPIDALRPVVEAHAGADSIMSRTDVWMLSAFTACDVMQGEERIDFHFRFVGRVDCEVANDVCLDEEGHEVECNELRGPHRHIPPADITTHDLFQFFEDAFGFSVKQTVALMGAHTVGELQAENSGFDGPNGWLLNNELFDNEYYAELVGGTSPDDPLNTLINTAPGWFLGTEDNSNVPLQRDRPVWLGFPDDTKIIMLNSDIALVRDLNEDNLVLEEGGDEPVGFVRCDFIGRDRCPHAEISFQFAVEYTFDNMLWLNDYLEAMDIMTTEGYNADFGCESFDVCFLTME